MVSRLLCRLDADIAATTHPVKLACLRAERAGYLARQGQLDEAREVLHALQQQYASQPNASVSGWLAWADGLVSHFSDLGQAAHDRMRRAYALSGAARDMVLHPLAAAWLAHMDYVRHDLAAMARHLSEALQFAEPSHHAARSRASLVLAQAYHFGNRYDLAQPWYQRVRHHGAADGDEATLSALMHNMAWLHAALSRQAALCGRTDASGAQQAWMGAQSTGNFDQLVGSASLDALVPILRAQVLSLQGRWADALALYDEHLNTALAQGLSRMQASLGADMAWCRLQSGDTEGALRDALTAQLNAPNEADVDDRASAHSRLAQVFAQLGHTDEATRHLRCAQADWQVHERDQAQAVTLANTVAEKLSAQ